MSETKTQAELVAMLEAIIAVKDAHIADLRRALSKALAQRETPVKLEPR